MAYTTINKSSDYFDTKLHNGNATAKTLAYDFEVDMFWTKMRNDAYPHNLFDVVRGNNQRLRVNQTNANGVAGNTVSFGNSSGISLGTDSGNYGTNKTQTDGGSQATYVGWGWKAGTGQGSSNTDGSINTTYTSVNTTAGFSISSYTGNATSGATVGHGLGVVPKMIIVKCTSDSTNWTVYTAATGNTDWLYLNASNAAGANSAAWNNTSPTASVFSLGNDGDVNGSGRTYIAYCFAEKTGYSKFGSYTGNGNSDGAFVYTGFKPEFVMTKKTSGTSSWDMHDTKRDTFNVATKHLLAEDAGAEGSTVVLDILSNGFKFRTSNGDRNASGGSYIYMAFGQSIVGTNNIPATAR